MGNKEPKIEKVSPTGETLSLQEPYDIHHIAIDFMFSIVFACVLLVFFFLFLEFLFLALLDEIVIQYINSN